MKKNKSANSTKALRKDIELKLTTHLTELTASLGKGTKKLKKEIEKGAKKLAKRISREITPLEPIVAVVAPVVKEAAIATDKKPVVQATAAVKVIKEKKVKPLK